MNNKGITLIAAIMMIVFAAIAVLSVSSFVVSRLTQEQTLQTRMDCLYLAQAGIENALYWFRANDASGTGHFSQGQSAVDATKFFVIGGTAADALIVNPSLAVLSNGSKDVSGCTLQNAVDTGTITINKMIITWNKSAKLQQISINGTTVFTGGNLSSPATVDITNFVLNTTPTVYPLTYIRFSASISGATVSLQCVMTDGSTDTVAQLFPAASNAGFTVKAMGKTTGSAQYRTLKADYNALTGKVTALNEIAAQMP